MHGTNVKKRYYAVYAVILRCEFYYLFYVWFRLLLVFLYFPYVPVLPV